jgi:tryptophan synthase alpha chain
MELLRATFNRLRRSRRSALIPFIMGGDPSLRATQELLLALEDAGADCIEVGIPFSDPLADGPVIQAASARALARGVTPAQVLSAVAAVRRRLRVPVACLTYWNPVLQFGGNGRGETPTPFLDAARRSGLSGLIVPDLPVEEGALLRRLALRAGVAPVFLAAPTSPPQRLRMIARASEGFIYYVSVTGTTGARRSLPAALRHGVRQLRLLTTKPICVGFGIATLAQAREVARIADGVIVGSALVRTIEQARTPAGALAAARTFLRAFRRAAA